MAVLKCSFSEHCFIKRIIKVFFYGTSPTIFQIPYVYRYSGILRWNNSFVRRVSSVLQVVLT